MKDMQQEMFQTGDDLPLFSGTSQAVHQTPPGRPPIDQTSFNTCKTCLGTGTIKNGSKLFFCNCFEGIRLKEIDIFIKDARRYMLPKYPKKEKEILFQQFETWLLDQKERYLGFIIAWCRFEESLPLNHPLNPNTRHAPRE